MHVFAFYCQGDIQANPEFPRDDSGTSDHTVDMVASSSSCDTVASSPDFNFASTVETTGQGVGRGETETAVTSTTSVRDGDDGDLTLVACDGCQAEVEQETCRQLQTLDADGSRAALNSVDGGCAEVIGENQNISISSPSHGLLIPVTENDPLGVFSCAARSGEAVVSSGDCAKPEEDVLGARLKFADVHPFGLNRAPASTAESANGTTSAAAATEDQVSSLESVQTVVSSRKSKSSHRGEIFGSVVRSAATKLFSTYKDLKKSISTQGARPDSESLGSSDDLDGDPGASTGGTISPEVRDADRVNNEENIAGAAAGADGDHAEMTPPKSRLRVPGLYAPLGI